MALREALSADGTSIVYRVEGRADGRPLVLVHGWSADLRCWGEAAAELARNYRVIALDLRGHGYSGAPEFGYDDPANWAADIAAVLAAECVAADAVLVGWSYGGIVISDYLTARGTGAVAGVIFTGAMANIGRDVPGARTGEALKRAMPGVFETSAGRAVRAFASFGDVDTDPGDNGVDVQRLFGASLATPPRVRRALFYRTVDNTAVLRGLDVPVLVLHGTADPVVPVDNGRYILESVPDGRGSFWEGARHDLFIEDRHRFVTEVSEFVDGL
ncbi:alpha/beta fold hydrolase [Nocardia arizonensis]|uniref:alpha/beta fold hydrolase n=1 Tax=Nocardia arizonensis TaxID=1141647 RepID=UPI0006CF4312|nr:alpha/beta hydrolase [Nocardia arizonensis]